MPVRTLELNAVLQQLKCYSRPESTKICLCKVEMHDKESSDM